MASASPLPKASMNLTLAAWISACNPATQTHTLSFIFQGRWRWASPETDSILPQCMQFYNYIARSSLLHEFSLLTSHFLFHAQGINISIRQREHWSTVFVFSRPLPVTLFAYVGGATHDLTQCMLNVLTMLTTFYHMQLLFETQLQYIVFQA